ncbi:MAG TPA: hypothetical protein VEH86_02075 [Candidatus Acidoferrum sp.]|nr:hypothetical protein [Candidatus Acidoferrum sp.]
MKKKVLAFSCLALLFALVNEVHASVGSDADKFLGNPLLILVALIVADIVAFAYHKLRK